MYTETVLLINMKYFMTRRKYPTRNRILKYYLKSTHRVACLSPTWRSLDMLILIHDTHTKVNIFADQSGRFFFLFFKCSFPS